MCDIFTSPTIEKILNIFTTRHTMPATTIKCFSFVTDINITVFNMCDENLTDRTLELVKVFQRNGWRL